MSRAKRYLSNLELHAENFTHEDLSQYSEGCTGITNWLRSWSTMRVEVSRDENGHLTYELWVDGSKMASAVDLSDVEGFYLLADGPFYMFRPIRDNRRHRARGKAPGSN